MMAGAKSHSGLELYLQQINQTPLLTAREECELAQRIRAGNCIEARDRMIRANLRLVVAIAKRYARHGPALGDLIEEGNLGLMRAVETYDPAHGARLSTYASWWIKQAIRRAMVNTVQPVRVPAYMTELISRWKRTGRQLEERLGRPPSLPELGDAMKLPPRKLRALHSAVTASQKPAEPVGEDPERSLRVTDLLADERTPTPDAALSLRDDIDAVARFLHALEPRQAQILRMRYGLDHRPPLTLKQIGERIGLTRERVRQLELQALKTLHRLIEGERSRPEAAFRASA